MHEVWVIGIAAGAGAALGVAAAGLLARSPRAPVAAAAQARDIGALLGWLVFDWQDAFAGAVGGERGGTAAGTAMLLVVAAVVVFALALIPIVGYLEALAIPALALRARQRAGEKYAGLRSLAK